MSRIFAGLALVAVLLLAPASSAQTVGAPLQVRTGEVYTVQFEQTQITRVGEQDVTVTVSGVYALNILDAENRLWRYTPVSIGYAFPSGLDGAAAAAAEDFNWAILSEAMSAFMRIAADVGFECRVDEYGRCVEMSNWPLWRDRAENLVLMFDAFLRLVPPRTPPAIEAPAEEAAAKPPADDESVEMDVEPAPAAPPFDWARARGPILRGISRLLDGVDSRDAGASMAGVNPGAALQGRTLTRRRTENVIEEAEMPFGAPPVRFVGTLRLERIDQRNNTGTIVRRVALDQASARASLQAIAQFVTTNLIEPVAAASAAEGEPPPDTGTIVGMINTMLESMDFSYEETTTGTVDLSTGMARETRTEFTFTMMPPGGAEAGEPVVMRGTTRVRVSLGAPGVARLPRGE